MRVEFRNLADGDALRATATLDESGRVVLTPEPGTRFDEAALAAITVTDSDGTVLTATDGERYLRALPHTFRSQALHAGFFPLLFAKFLSR